MITRFANKPMHWQSVYFMSVDDKKCKINEEMTIDINMNRLTKLGAG
jgi:hypothetical protein